MEERNVIIRNVAVADLRRAGEDKLSSIRRVENCALLVTADDADLSHVEKRNVAMSMTLPRDTIFRQINGQGSISASDGDEGKVYLMVNGHLNVESDVTPEMITRRFAGMMINGSVNCPRSVSAAMESIGARINGSMSTYPDGAVLRGGRVVLDMAAVEGMDAALYSVDSVLALDGDAVRAAQDKGIRFYTGKAVCSAALRSAVMRLMEQCAPAVTEVPEGMEYADNPGRVDRLRARRMKGSLFMEGGLELGYDVRPEDKKHLTALHVTGKLTMTEAQFDALEQLDMDCAGLTLRDKPDIEVGDDYALCAAALESLDDGRRLLVKGVLHIDADVTAELLRRKIASADVKDDVIAPKELWGVLAERVQTGGEFLTDDSMGGMPPFMQGDAPREEGMVYVENMAVYEM